MYLNSPKLLLLAYFFTILFLSGYTVFAGITIEDLEEEAAMVANKTYQENQTELQQIILKNYNREERPVRRQDSVVIVHLYPYITHMSIDQLEQTVTLNGIMHMKWKDENATWEPSERNGVKVTNLKQWEIWHPDIMVLNSATGVGDYFQFSRNIYATLTSYGRAYTEVYVYPRFSIKIGCNFDYSAYPNDIQRCVLGVYTKYHLKHLNLTVANFEQGTRQAIEWRSKKPKLFISDWQIQKVQSYSVFYADYYGTMDQWESTMDPELAVSMMHTDIVLQRYAPYYSLSIILPALVSSLMLICSYFLLNPSSAVYLLIAHFFLIGIFIGNLLHVLPPASGSLPKIAYFYGANLILTVASIFLQFWFLVKLKAVDSVTGIPKYIALGKIFVITFIGFNSGAQANTGTETEIGGKTYELNWLFAVDAVRNLCALLCFIIVFIFVIYVTV